ncbi:MAG: heme exporter protein CcmD [Hyphomicrobiales bacterium]|nr:heme exporter protein CcmD [Hyphomicrobiales bacterium]
MGKYALFIIASYGITGISIAGLIAWIVIDYRRLRKALAKFPPREGQDL